MSEKQLGNQLAASGSEQRDELSLVQVIWQDYAAFFSVIAPLILWILFIYFTYSRGPGANTNFLLACVALTLLGFGVLIWRVMVFRALFADHVKIEAIINDVSFYRDRGRVNFVFTYNGQKYLTGTGIMKTKRTKALKNGECVTVLVDRNQPKRAVIQKLYSRGG